MRLKNGFDVISWAKTSCLVYPMFPAGDNVVIWSGGADSTLILISLIRNEYKKPKERRKPIYVISVKWCHLAEQKRINEEKAREEIKKLIKRFKVDVRFNTIVYDADGDNDFLNRGISQGQMQQCNRMLYEALTYAPDGSNIWMGHLHGEDFFVFRDHWETLINFMCNLNNKKVSLCLPFMWINKPTVLTEHIRDNTINVISTCEAPNKDGSPCGKCRPCRERRAALLEILLDKDARGKDHEVAAELLKDEIETISYYKEER